MKCKIKDCDSDTGQERVLTTFDNKTFKVIVCDGCLDKFDSPEEMIANATHKVEVKEDDKFYHSR